MAILHIEGFDLTGTAEADLQAKGSYHVAKGAIATTGGKFGGGSFVADSLNTLSWTDVASLFTQYVTMSVWIKTPSTLNLNWNLLSVTDQTSDTALGTGDVHFGVGYNADGSWRIGGDSSSAKATSATGLIAPNTWYHIEAQCNMAAAGSCTLYVDGEVMLTVASGDFKEGNTLSTYWLSGSANGLAFDDWVIQADGSALPDLLGLHRIHSLLPSADTAQADFTGAFGDIDDALGTTHDGDTTVISSATLNHKSEFAMTDLTGTPATVYAVQSTIVSSKTDAGSKAVTPYIVSNSVRADGVEFNPADGAYIYTDDVHELNPDGSVAWTSTTVNAILMGVEVTT